MGMTQYSEKPIHVCEDCMIAPTFPLVADIRMWETGLDVDLWGTTAGFGLHRVSRLGEHGKGGIVHRMKTLRNVAIVASIAAAVHFLPGGGQVAEAFAAALWIVFMAGAGYLCYRLYRERRIELYGLGARHRALLYGALAGGYAAIAARARLWESGAGEFAWFVAIGLCAWVLLVVYRYSRSY